MRSTDMEHFAIDRPQRCHFLRCRDRMDFLSKFCARLKFVNAQVLAIDVEFEVFGQIQELEFTILKFHHNFVA